jgi:hypothetical protein
MKKIFAAFCLTFIFTVVTYAGGGITHMFLAEETIALLPDATLRGILLTHLDAYRVGAYYPDSGFVGDNEYGEDSHWDPFINAFLQHIKLTYPNPTMSNPKLVAFFFGCAVHRLSDEIMHWTFYNVSKDKDFAGDWNLAHQYGDIGIDLLVNIDKNQWATHPSEWWVPVRDLVAVYHAMGKDHYTAEQIIRGNIALYFAGYGERLISIPAYAYLQQRMPWTAAHYYDWSEGGVLADEQAVAHYLQQLWEILQQSLDYPAPTLPRHVASNNEQPILVFAESIVKTGAVQIDVTQQIDGSVVLTHPTIKEPIAFQKSLAHVLSH